MGAFQVKCGASLLFWDASRPGLTAILGQTKCRGTIQWWRREQRLQYSCLENSMTEERGGLQSMGSESIRHDWVTHTHTHTHTHTQWLSWGVHGVGKYQTRLSHSLTHTPTPTHTPPVAQLRSSRAEFCRHSPGLLDWSPGENAQRLSATSLLSPD